MYHSFAFLHQSLHIGDFKFSKYYIPKINFNCLKRNLKRITKTFLVHSHTRIPISIGIPTIPFNQSSRRNRNGLIRCRQGRCWAGMGNQTCNAINNTNEHDGSTMHKQNL